MVGTERLEVVSEHQATIDTSLPFLLQEAMLVTPVAAVMTALSKISPTSASPPLPTVYFRKDRKELKQEMWAGKKGEKANEINMP